MSKWIALCALGLVLAVGGCKNKDEDMNGTTEPKKMSIDACSKCAGHQTATSDGKCSMCGAKAQM